MISTAQTLCIFLFANYIDFAQRDEEEGISRSKFV
jgi:hypothetical protein